MKLTSAIPYPANERNDGFAPAVEALGGGQRIGLEYKCTHKSFARLTHFHEVPEFINGVEADGVRDAGVAEDDGREVGHGGLGGLGGLGFQLGQREGFGGLDVLFEEDADVGRRGANVLICQRFDFFPNLNRDTRNAYSYFFIRSHGFTPDV